MVANLFVFSDTYLLPTLREIFESHKELCISRTAETFLVQFLMTVTRGFGLLPTLKHPAAREGKKKTSDTQQALVDVHGTYEWYPKPVTRYLDKVISTSERGVTGTVNKGEVDVVH